MDSLPTGSIQSWAVIAAIAVTPMLLYFLVGTITDILYRRSRSVSWTPKMRQVAKVEPCP